MYIGWGGLLRLVGVGRVGWRTVDRIGLFAVFSTWNLCQLGGLGSCCLAAWDRIGSFGRGLGWAACNLIGSFRVGEFTAWDLEGCVFGQLVISLVHLVSRRSWFLICVDWAACSFDVGVLQLG